MNWEPTELEHVDNMVPRVHGTMARNAVNICCAQAIVTIYGHYI